MTDQIRAQDAARHDGPGPYRREGLPLQQPGNDPTDRRGLSLNGPVDRFFLRLQVRRGVAFVEKKFGAIAIDHAGTFATAGTWASEFTGDRQQKTRLAPRWRSRFPSLMAPPPRSKFFAAILAAVMQDRGINQVQLSERSGIVISRVNNYLKGKYRTIKPAHLEAITAALGGPSDNAALVQAYFFDLLPESCRGLVEIRVPGAREAGKWEVPSKGLPRDFAAALRSLYVLCVSSVKVREYTREWIALMRETKR